MLETKTSIEKVLIEKYGIINRSIKTREIDINESIGELSYLTHSYYRYYGKFPSKLASTFLDDYSNPDTVLLDNYSGSGTSLVEASLRGIRSYGVDINPTAVLASNVKTYKYSQKNLLRQWSYLSEDIHKAIQINEDFKIPTWNSLYKWFAEDVAKTLSIIQNTLEVFKFDDRQSEEFFKLAFYSIIRRVSRAYDGEVRPHINKTKKQRNPVEAFSKKVKEMIDIAGLFELANTQNPQSKTFLASNNNLDEIEELKDAGINLVLSHPPYLNCFDYLPVYSLELNWAESDKNQWNGYNLAELKKMETKSWPATNEKIMYGFFDGIENAYKQVYDLLPKGGICGIVMGDSTIRGELIRVHLIVAAICEKMGFELIEIVYRTTNYSTGKYSYKHRADYHGADEAKRDGILVLKKK